MDSFSSVTTQTQARVTIYYHCIVFLLSFDGNNSVIAIMTENAVNLRYEARIFLLVDLWDFFFRFRVGGTKKKKKALKMISR